MVNRVWHWLFGAGLVRTTDNFGTTGEAPSHPELLDYLTVRFIEDDWSVKKLVRELVLSHTYQLASEDHLQARAIDPENRLLSRMNRRRLDAEAIRDSILLASGQLRWNGRGPTFPGSLASDYGYEHKTTCRSVYVPVFRNALPDIFEVFDFPDASKVSGVRNASTVAPQALFLMNDPFVMEQAESTAARLLSMQQIDTAGRLEIAYRMLLGRPPTDGERTIAGTFLKSFADESDSEASTIAWTRIVQAIIASPDFRYVK
jgi:hypothetical protein